MARRGKLGVGQKKNINKQLAVNPEEERMARIMTKLEGYEEWQKDVPALLKKAILEGKDASQLYEQFSSVAAVRVIQILMTEGDSGKALAAAKELLDRQYGRATEKKIVRHQFDDMPDDDLDAILISELEELTDD